MISVEFRWVEKRCTQNYAKTVTDNRCLKAPWQSTDLGTPRCSTRVDDHRRLSLKPICISKLIITVESHAPSALIVHKIQFSRLIAAFERLGSSAIIQLIQRQNLHSKLWRKSFHHFAKFLCRDNHFWLRIFHKIPELRLRMLRRQRNGNASAHPRRPLTHDVRHVVRTQKTDALASGVSASDVEIVKDLIRKNVCAEQNICVAMTSKPINDGHTIEVLLGLKKNGWHQSSSKRQIFIHWLICWVVATSDQTDWSRDSAKRFAPLEF